MALRFEDTEGAFSQPVCFRARSRAAALPPSALAKVMASPGCRASCDRDRIMMAPECRRGIRGE